MTQQPILSRRRIMIGASASLAVAGALPAMLVRPASAGVVVPVLPGPPQAAARGGWW